MICRVLRYVRGQTDCAQERWPLATLAPLWVTESAIEVLHEVWRFVADRGAFL